MEFKPIRRNNDLVTQEVKKETLIYDLKINKAYCLNQTSAFIWQCCDGKNTVSDIKKKMSREYAIPIDDDLIWLALDKMNKDRLIENGSEIPHKFVGLSRREVIRKVGFASILTFPIISSLVAPSAAQAQSVAPIVGCRRIIPGGVCLEQDCLASTCSGFGCSTIEEPASICCSGTLYAVVQPSPPGSFDVSYFCK